MDKQNIVENHNIYKINDNTLKVVFLENVIIDYKDIKLNNINEILCFIIKNSNNYKMILKRNDYCLLSTLSNKYSKQEVHDFIIKFLSYNNNGLLTKNLIKSKIEISTMESCTSGLIASNITDYEGASSILNGSLITYSNEAKIKNGVSASIIKNYGVYSKETAIEMAWNTKVKHGSNISIGITGSFGNVDPANKDSIAGEIYYCILTNSDSYSFKLIYSNINLSRKNIKQKTADIALATINSILF